MDYRNSYIQMFKSRKSDYAPVWCDIWLDCSVKSEYFEVSKYDPIQLPSLMLIYSSNTSNRQQRVWDMFWSSFAYKWNFNFQSAPKTAFFAYKDMSLYSG